MTRFARAKGSKASNERREEEATPWHVMRQQLAEQLSNYQAQSGTNTSYNLKEILSNKSSRQKEEVWSEFGETRSNLKNHLKLEEERNTNERCNIKEIKINNNDDTEALSKGGGIEDNFDSNKKPKLEATEIDSLKKRKSKREKKVSYPNVKSVQKDSTVRNVGSRGTKFSVEIIQTSSDGVITSTVKDGDNKNKVKFNHKKSNFKNFDNNVDKSRQMCMIKKNRKERLHGKNVFVETPIEPTDSFGGFQSSFPEKLSTKLKNIGLSVEFEKSVERTRTKKKTRVESKTTEVENPENNVDDSSKPFGSSTSLKHSLSNKQQPSKSKKNSNIKSDKQIHSNYSTNSKPYANSGNDDFHENQFRKNNLSKHAHQKSFHTIIANGREIRVVQFQGFFIKKDDAEELKKLRKKLLAQKIPKEKLEHIIKLERRKAEKALVREKKKVCFQCRQFGHNFSDCPETKNSNMVKTGMCFKCGSLEHTHFECKVQQHQEYRHAECFVCKEQGHIARQCPLNSQGLYPKGGSCHLCGEVTHLRKDCPKAVEEKTSKSVTVDTLVNGTVEDIIGKTLQQKENETKKKKVIKFK